MSPPEPTKSPVEQSMPAFSPIVVGARKSNTTVSTFRTKIEQTEHPFLESNLPTNSLTNSSTDKHISHSTVSYVLTN